MGRIEGAVEGLDAGEIAIDPQPQAGPIEGSATTLSDDVAVSVKRRVRTAAIQAFKGFDAFRFFAAVGATILAIRILGQAWKGSLGPSFPDSFSYLSVARLGPFHPGFYVAERPLTYPLLLWATGRAARLTVLVQVLSYIAAWIFLLNVARQRFGKVAAAVFGIGCVMAALQPRFVVWSTLILSESMSLSLSVLLFALCLRTVDSRAQKGLAATTIVSVLWIMIRDSNAAIALVTCAMLAILCLRWESARRRQVLVCLGLCCLAACFSYVGADVSGRTAYAIPNNVGLRILQRDGLTKWFEAGGMPVDAAVLERKGKNSFDDGNKFMNDPALARFRSWAKHKGTVRFSESLVLRAGDWVPMMVADMPTMLGNDVEFYDNHGVKENLFHGPQIFALSPRSPRAFGIAGVAALVALWWCATDRRRRAMAMFGIVLVLSSYLDVYVSYVGDSVEWLRHEVGAVLRVELVLLFALALLVGKLYDTFVVRPASSDKPFDRERPHLEQVTEVPVEADLLELSGAV